MRMISIESIRQETKQTPDGLERRRRPRRSGRFTVHLRSVNRGIDGRMHTSIWKAIATDVSDGGFMLESCKALLPGERCRVRIEEADLRITGVVGRVLRCNYSPAGYQIAITLENFGTAVA